MAGNWKMYKNPSETAAFFNSFKPLVASAKHCEIVLCPPFVNVPAAVAATQGSNIGIGAQNLFWAAEGAYTGEVSAPMIRAAGAQWVIIGHSERRQYFGETDETVNRRVTSALAHGLKSIMCVGETLEQRQANKTRHVLVTQTRGGLDGVAVGADFVIAYEPVWAIGTGLAADGATAQEAIALIRATVRELAGEVASSVRILYGGSVTGDNIAEFMSQPDVDGGLVGGASLDPDDFARIIRYSK